MLQHSCGGQKVVFQCANLQRVLRFGGLDQTDDLGVQRVAIPGRCCKDLVAHLS